MGDPTKLLKLHLKHYHMSTEQFEMTTTQLQLPKDTIDLYDTIVKNAVLVHISLLSLHEVESVD